METALVNLHLCVCILFVHGLAVSHTRCLETSFYNGTTCVACPSNCTACNSSTVCTKCMNGFYGDLCKTPCPHTCSLNGCHMQSGHCTHGCPDGQYASVDNFACVACPENCSLCSSVSYCFTCRKGFYGPDCSRICQSECAGGVCNQSTGHCLQCKDGYYTQSGNCMQCPHGCAHCIDATDCSACQKLHVGPFNGQCFLKCSEKSAHFVSSDNQLCGIPQDQIQYNQVNCSAIMVGRSYSCTTFRHCIDCATYGDKCLPQATESQMCVWYERCITECNPPRKGHVLHSEYLEGRYVLCEQSCSRYHARYNDTALICPLTTQDNISRREKHFAELDCFQESEEAIYSLADENFNMNAVQKMMDFTITLLIVVVVMVCLLFVLMMGIVAYQRRKRCLYCPAKTVQSSRSPEVTKVLETVELEENASSGRAVVYLSPISEGVYEKAD